MKKISRFPPRNFSLFTTVVPQDPSGNSLLTTVTWMNTNTAKFKGAFSELPMLIKPNTLNKIFDALNATEAMKSYLFTR